MKRRTFLHYLDNNSVYFSIPVVWKFLFFITLSSLPLLSHNLRINLLVLVVVAMLILRSGYYYRSLSSIKLLLLSFCSFMLIWILFSKVEGKFVYVIFPWGTRISEQTVPFALSAAIRWILICQAGIFFLVATSQNEVIDALVSVHAPHQFVLSLTIALNTIVFVIEALPQINIALNSRNIPNTTILENMQRLRLIGTSLLVESVIKIVFLRIAYHFDVVELEQMQEQGENRSINKLPTNSKPAEDERGIL